jgi:hypothetical protein
MVAPGLSHILTAEKEKKNRELEKVHSATPPQQNFSLLLQALGKSKNNNEGLILGIKFEQTLCTV